MEINNDRCLKTRFYSILERDIDGKTIDELINLFDG